MTLPVPSKVGPRPRPVRPNEHKLSVRQGIAAQRFAEAWLAARDEQDTRRRMAGSDLIRNAKRILQPLEYSVLEMVSGRRANVSDISRRTNRTQASLWRLMESACTALADHLETQAMEESR